MAVHKTVTVSITPEQHTFINHRLRADRFGHVSEVMPAALRLLQKHETGFPAHLAPQPKPPKPCHAC